MDRRPFNVLSLCSGGGGLDLGIRSAVPTARTVCYVEREAFPIAVLEARMQDQLLDAAPIWTDVATFDGKPWRGVVDCIAGGYPCFVAGTLILTREGYRPIESLAVGDTVLTHAGRWKAVTAVMRRDNAPIQTVEAGGSLTTRTTAEHPYYTRHKSFVWNNHRRSSDRTFGQPEWTAAANLTGNHFVGQVLPASRTDDKATDFWWLVGRYLADGWRRPDGADTGRVIICAGYKKADELECRISAAGYTAWRENDRTAVKFHITRTELWKFLAPFGAYAYGKTLPGFIFELPTDKARALLDGYATGDGSRQGRETRITTTSPYLALGVALLAQRTHGVVAGVRYQDLPNKCIIEGRECNQRGFYVITIPDRNRVAVVDGDYGWKRVRSSTPSGYDSVYNISVEDDESYVANGCIVHNCQPFSSAGKRLGEDDPRHLWPHIKRIIGEIQPEYCFFENVRGHLSLGFEQVWGDLRGLGYEVEAGLFSAEEVGAPHLRERLYILAKLADTGGRIQSRERRLGDVGGTAGRVQDSQEERKRLRNATWNGGTHRWNASVADAESQCQRESQYQAHTVTGEGQTREVPGVGSTPPLGHPNGAVCGHGHDGTQRLFPRSPEGDEGRGTTLPDADHGDAQSRLGFDPSRIPAKLDRSKKRSSGVTSGHAAQGDTGEILPLLWTKDGAEDIQRKVGGYGNLPTTALLRSDVLRPGSQARTAELSGSAQKVLEVTREEVRDLRNNGEPVSASHRLESGEQRFVQPDDAVRFLSHAVALGAWEDVTKVCSLSNLRSTLQRLRLVPETLSEVQETWRSLPSWDQGWAAAVAIGIEPWPAGPGTFQHEWEPPRISRDCPNRADRLKLLGNSVVPQTAALAWRTLFPRLQ